MIDRLARRLRALWRRDAMNVELDRELRYHIDRQIEANVRDGMGPEEARAAALRAFGGLEQSKELCRDARGVRWLEDFWQDVRFGSRSLAKRPGFAAVALVTLALGIGANAAIFSVIDAVLLRKLPYQDPNRLVVVWENRLESGGRSTTVSPVNFFDWSEQNTSFEPLVALVTFRRNLTGVGEPVELRTQLVTAGFFEMLGVSPLLGRALGPDDYPETENDVVVLSYGLWQSRFGGDPGVVGRLLAIDGRPRTVVGVMPRGFELTIKEKSNVSGSADAWAPLRPARTWSGRFLTVAGRLKPGVTVEAASAEMSAIAARIADERPEFNKGFGVRVVPLRDQLVGTVRPALLVLSGAVGLVLLIACANVANLLLMRAASRQGEIAVRSALGAGRRRVVRQLLTESLCLSALGGLLGLLLALGGTNLLLALAPAGLLDVSDVRLDLRMLAFTAAVSVATGLVFGLVPALQASRADLGGTLKEGGRRAGADRASARLSHAFVVSEVALALVLLIGAGLLVRSFVSLRAVDPGFRAEGLATAKLELPSRAYPDESQCVAFYAGLLERVRALPGVDSASVVSALPFGGLGSTTSFAVDGRPAPPHGEEPSTDVTVVDPTYFETMGIPVMAGRTFTPHEAQVASHVVIVSEAFAKQFWPGESPLGHHIRVDMMDDPPSCEIVGIVGDVRTRSLEEPVAPMVYWPHPELPETGMAVVVRGDGDPNRLFPSLRESVRALDPDLPVSDMQAMEVRMADSLARSRFTALLLAIFGSVAFVLAVIGIYGVLSYAVALRTNDIGIRMALGAQRSDVLRMVLLDGLRLTAAGLTVGLVAAVALNGFVASLLYGVTGTDVLTYAAASLLFFAVAVLACVVPARRAVAVDPIVALR